MKSRHARLSSALSADWELGWLETYGLEQG